MVDVSPLRPYLLTSGRVRPVDRRIALEAQVRTTPSGADAYSALAFEHRDIVAVCIEPLSVAEVAARLGLHIGVARVLVGDLAGLGYLDVHLPARGRERDVALIERVIRGLNAIA